MRRGVLARFIMFAVAALAAIVYLLPNLVDPLPSWWSSFLPSEKIHLGLDLQGGTHLILEVQVDKAVEHNIERVRNDLVTLFRERGLSGVSVERVQGTQLQIRAPADSVERVRGVLKGDFPNLAVVDTQTAAGTTEFFVTLSKEELRAVRDFAVDQSLETIRNRIDQFGVSEPIIQRQGQQDILIQLPGIQDPDRAKEIIGKTALLEFKLVDDNADVESAIRTGPPPGREVLYGYGDKAEGGSGTPKTAYVVESRTLMTGE